MDVAEAETSIASTGPVPAFAPNIDEGRFPPGLILAQRYRIVSLLGRGGMGEVYRANDLLFGQPVALKFLLPAATASESALSRFRSEVRTARLEAAFPPPTNLSSWYSDATLLATAGVLVLAVYTFHTTLAGRPLWRHRLHGS